LGQYRICGYWCQIDSSGNPNRHRSAYRDLLSLNDWNWHRIRTLHIDSNWNLDGALNVLNSFYRNRHVNISLHFNCHIHSHRNIPNYRNFVRTWNRNCALDSIRLRYTHIDEDFHRTGHIHISLDEHFNGNWDAHLLGYLNPNWYWDINEYFNWYRNSDRPLHYHFVWYRHIDWYFHLYLVWLLEWYSDRAGDRIRAVYLYFNWVRLRYWYIYKNFHGYGNLNLTRYRNLDGNWDIHRDWNIDGNLNLIGHLSRNLDGVRAWDVVRHLHRDLNRNIHWHLHRYLHRVRLGNWNINDDFHGARHVNRNLDLHWVGPGDIHRNTDLDGVRPGYLHPDWYLYRIRDLSLDSDFDRVGYINRYCHRDLNWYLHRDTDFNWHLHLYRIRNIHSNPNLIRNRNSNAHGYGSLHCNWIGPVYRYTDLNRVGHGHVDRDVNIHRVRSGHRNINWHSSGHVYRDLYREGLSYGNLARHRLGDRVRDRDKNFDVIIYFIRYFNWKRDLNWNINVFGDSTDNLSLALLELSR